MELMALKEINPDLKILLSVGGWNMGSDPFISVTNTEDDTQDFVFDAIIFLRAYGFDGLDIDWEYPDNMQARYSSLIKV